MRNVRGKVVGKVGPIKNIARIDINALLSQFKC